MEKSKKEEKEEADFNPLLIEDDPVFVLQKLELNNEFVSYYREMMAYLTEEEKELLYKIKKPRRV